MSHACDRLSQGACPHAEATGHAGRLQAVGGMLGGVLHDVNNLLGVALGHVDVANASSTMPPEIADHLVAIQHAITCCGGLCRDVLAFVGKGSTVSETIDVAALIRDMDRLLRTVVKGDVNLECKLAEPLPFVHGNPNHLRQILLNLVLNAVDSLTGNQEGRVVVEATGVAGCEGHPESPVRVPRRLRITVSDTGCGMDATVRAQLFDAFFTTKLTGRGLGMTEVRMLIDSMDGDISVESEPGVGSVFTILMPASDGPLASGTADTHVGVKSDKCTFSGTVLLVDDEANLRLIGRQLLGLMGFDVLMAADGASAVSMFRSHGGDICAVLLDAEMPGMDGCSAMREIRSIEPSVPIVIISGHPEVDLAPAFGDVCPDAVLLKPAGLDQICAVMTGILPARGGGDGCTH